MGLFRDGSDLIGLLAEAARDLQFDSCAAYQATPAFEVVTANTHRTVLFGRYAT